jgi:hypothetical protein
MADIVGVSIPDINITGLFSSTWVYVAIIAVIGVILIIGVALLLYFKTFNRKVIFFENISGLGYQPTLRKRARSLKVGQGGEEVLSLIGGDTISAYGRKMGKNTYWFAKGIDGYWYNFLLGDLDTKMAMLDIEPIDRDVRMFHVAKDRMNRDNYLRKSFLEKYGSVLLMFLFLIVLIIGMWLIVGKIGKATTALAETAKTNEKLTATNLELLRQNEKIQPGGIEGVVSGMVPAT